MSITATHPGTPPGVPATRPIELVSALLLADWAGARQLLDQSESDPEQLLAWLKRHHLAGQFSAIVAESPLVDAFAPSLLQKTAQHLDNQRRHNARVLEVSKSAVSTLQQCDIPTILLKGVHFAQRFHGGLTRRFLWDVDLLVQQQHREVAIRCLRQHGYQTQTGALWNNRISRRLAHAVSLQVDHQGRPIELDLHWHLRNRPAFRIDYQALWQTRQSFHLDGSDFDVPSDEYCLLTLLLGIAHDLESGRFKLKQMFDLHCMLHALDAQLDWPAFFAARERERLAVLAANVLALYQLLFAASAGPSKLPRLSAALRQHSGNIVIHHLSDAQKLAEGPRQNLRNRRWYASIYPGGPLNYAIWWSATVPLRYAMGRTW